MEFLDRKISKENQLRIVVGVLCIMVLYTMLMDFVPVRFAHASDVRKITFHLANIFVFLYLYKFVCYDLKLKLHIVFITIIVLVHVYYIVAIPYRLFIPDPEDGFVAHYMPFAVIGFISLIGMLGIAIQLFFNKSFNKKIKIILQVLGGSFLLKLIAPSTVIFLGTMLVDAMLISMTDMDTLVKFATSFFHLIPYIIMIYLYVRVLDQPVVEEEL